MSTESDYNASISYFDSLQRARSASIAKIQAEQDKRDVYLADTHKVSTDVADIAGQLLPAKVKIKKTEFAGGNPALAVDQAFGEDNPLKGIGQEVMDITRSLKGKSLSGVDSGEDLVGQVFNEVYKERAPEAFQHKLKQETSIFGSATGDLPGYNEFKAKFDAENRPDVSAYYKGITPTGVAQNLGVAAAGNLALEGVGQVAKAAGWKLGAKAAGRGLFGLPAVGTPGLVAKLAGLALMTAADFAMFDAAGEVVGQSKWAKARPDEPWKVLAAEGVAGLGASAVMAPRLAKSMKTFAFDKVYNDAAAEVLAKNGTVSSLMEYSRSFNRLNKSKKVSTDQMDAFILRNKNAVEELNFQKNIPDLYRGGPYAFFNKDMPSIDATTKELPGVAGRVEPLGLEAPAPKTGLYTGKPGVDGLGTGPTIYPEAKIDPGPHAAPGVIEGLPTIEPKLIGEVPERALVQRRSVGVPDRVANDNWINDYSVEVHDAGWKDHTPMLGGVESRLALPAPMEKLVGSNISLRGRVAMRTAYEQNSGLNRATVILGENGLPELRPEALTKITEFFSHHADARQLKADLLGQEFASTVKAINTDLAKMPVVQPRTLTENALSYGLDTASHGQKLRVLDSAGIEEVKTLSAEGIPNSLSVPAAASNSIARVVRSTIKASGERDAKVLSATVKDTVQAREGTKSVIVRSKSRPDNVGLTAENEEKLISKGAEKSTVVIPKEPVVAEVGKPTGVVLSAERLAMFKAAKAKQKRGALSAASASNEEKMAKDAALMDFASEDPGIGSLVKKGLITIPLAAVAMLALDGDNAEAGILGSVTALAADAAKKAVGEVSAAKLIETLRASSMVGEKGTILGQVKKWQDGFSLNPTLDSIKEITSKVPGVIRNFVMTPGAVADFFYKGDKNPLVELASRMTAMHTNIKMHTQAVKEIISLVPEYKNASTEIRKAMRPLVEKYDTPLGLAGYHEGMAAQLGKRIGAINKKKNPGEYAEAVADLRENAVKLRDAKEGIKDYEQDWTNSVQDLAQKHSGTRLALALEDTADFSIYPWLKPLMQPNELSAVSKLKDLTKVTEGRILDAGGMVIKDRPFAHHAIHPDSNMKQLQDALAGVTIHAHDALNLAKLNSRSIGSRMMMPDVEFMFDKYIPDVERRIQTMQFWKKGEEGGWAAHQNDLRSNNLMSRDVKDFWRGINDSFAVEPQTKPAEWAKRYYSLEVAWRLFMSPSVGFKHIMKQVGNLAIFPVDVWAKGISRAPGVMFKAHMQGLKERWPETFKNVQLKQSDEVDLVRAYMNQGKYNSAIAELDMYDAPINAFDKVLDKFNNFGSAIVGTVESFDRTATILMGMEMAAKKGMTPSQATYAVYDSILKANFLSGVHNPAWVRDPHARAFFMFQGTPFKIMEQRLMQAAKAGKSIVKAGGVTLDELKNLRHYMKEGEYKIKHGLIMDALGSEKDIYGQSVTKQFAVNALTVGGLIGAGDYFFDSNVQDQVLHLPFFKIGGSSPGLMLNPMVGAGYKTWTQRHAEDHDMLFSEFINNWAGGTGAVPSTIRKSMRLSVNDIPEIYRGSKFRYFFGIGASKE